MGFFFNNTGSWILHTHLFIGDTYECSECHREYGMQTRRCPGCHAEMTGDKYSPDWVDDMIVLDAILDEDDDDDW